jgi:hypothetical protein
MKHALTQWLELFSVEDWSIFGQFLEMPEHSRKKLPRKLFHYLSQKGGSGEIGELISGGELKIYQHLWLSASGG